MRPQLIKHPPKLSYRFYVVIITENTASAEYDISRYMQERS
jgi:hypothetical protein